MADHDIVRAQAEAAFKTQRKNALRRGVQWALTFDEWCDVWAESGHWHERGKGQGQYVMSRRDDSGPYRIGNIFIQPAVDNASQRPQKQTALPMGVQQTTSGMFMVRRKVKGVRKYLGSFSTIQEAQQVYERNY